MKCVILCGGLGTRLGEETQKIPKPMVLIGGKPILWHIMKHYSFYGINEFVLCLGYKSNIIKEYFYNYPLYNSKTVSVEFFGSHKSVKCDPEESWKIDLVDTGLETLTSERLLKVLPYLNNKTFCCTYGDGLSDVNINSLVTYHCSLKQIATMTIVQQKNRFGCVTINNQNGQVLSFDEKPLESDVYTNSGFFVFGPDIYKYLNKGEMLESFTLPLLAQNTQLNAYVHNGFWQCMDTLAEKEQLEKMWKENKSPWKVW
jgi:glucose-1-phosphate cytidylyltransferase